MQHQILQQLFLLPVESPEMLRVANHPGGQYLLRNDLEFFLEKYNLKRIEGFYQWNSFIFFILK